jgi:hypothetical protein
VLSKLNNFFDHFTFFLLLTKLKYFGLEVIQAVIRHLSVPEFGISEMELLDVLSSNQELMKALDLDNKPICRFPPYLWIALKHELGKNLLIISLIILLSFYY